MLFPGLDDRHPCRDWCGISRSAGNAARRTRRASARTRGGASASPHTRCCSSPSPAGSQSSCLLLGWSIRVAGAADHRALAHARRRVDRHRRARSRCRVRARTALRRVGGVAGRHFFDHHALRRRDVARARDSRERERRSPTPASTRSFYHFVPGFDGVRVPARFAMIVTLGLAALAALGVGGARTPRPAIRCVVLAGALIVVEAVGDADSDQPEFHRLHADGPRAAAAASSRSATPRRRSIASSRSFRVGRRSSSFRSASRPSTFVTCSIQRCTGNGSSTATAAARRWRTSS